MPPYLFAGTAIRRRILTKSLQLRHLHSPPPPSAEIHHPLTHPIYTVWAANTCLGKTLVSAGISMSFLLSPTSTTSKKFVYLKPVQTGFPADSDSRFVYRKFSQFFLHQRPPLSVFASNRIEYASLPACKALLGDGFEGEIENDDNFGSGFKNLGRYEERKLETGERADMTGEVSQLICKTMYGWRDAVSPHLAAEREGAVVGDSQLLETLKRCLWIGTENGNKKGNREEEGKVDVMCVVETAGGVASPGPSGSLQCDLYRCQH